MARTRLTIILIPLILGVGIGLILETRMRLLAKNPRPSSLAISMQQVAAQISGRYNIQFQAETLNLSADHSNFASKVNGSINSNNKQIQFASDQLLIIRDGINLDGHVVLNNKIHQIRTSTVRIAADGEITGHPANLILKEQGTARADRFLINRSGEVELAGQVHLELQQ